MKTSFLTLLAAALMLVAVAGDKKGKGVRKGHKLPNINGLYETIDPADGGVFKFSIYNGQLVLTDAFAAGACSSDGSLGAYATAPVENLSRQGFDVVLAYSCRDGSLTDAPFPLRFDFTEYPGIWNSTQPLTGDALTIFKIGPVGA